MCKREVFATASSIYDIDINFFKKFNIKTLLLDLDNTLDSYKLYEPTEKARNLIGTLKQNNINPIIVSNNKGKRVSTYANHLGVNYINSAWKPFARKINAYIATNKLNKDEIMIVGDQMVTDVGAANRAKIKVILTDKIVKEDQWTTRFNRILGRLLRKHYTKKGKLINWRSLYGEA